MELKLHELKPKFPSRKKKLIGRGGKRGTYSGRGGKGQTARAGYKISSHVRFSFLERFPKIKGFKSLKVRPVILNLDDLQKKFKTGEEITIKKLYEVGLIRSPKLKVKILGNGKLTKKFTVEAHDFSKSAKEKIKKAGGKVIKIKRLRRLKLVTKKAPVKDEKMAKEGKVGVKSKGVGFKKAN